MIIDTDKLSPEQRAFFSPAMLAMLGQVQRQPRVGIPLDSSIFDLTPIHQKYWKDFCDVCYSRFGFEQGEVRTYEQKYETFCRCKNYVTSEEGYEEQLLMTKEEDLVRLQSYAEWFYGIDDACDILPALYNLVRMLWTIRRNLKSDMQLIKYFCPRRPKVNYSDYKLELKKIPDCIRNNKTIREVLRSEIDATLLQAIMGEDDFYYQTMDMTIKSELQDGTPFEYNNADGSIVSMVNYILDEHVHWYNTELNDFVESLPDGCECARGSEMQAFIYRLFMSYGQSLREIKELVEEYPAPRNLEVLKGEYECLVEEFEDTRLGEHWIECIEEKEGLQHIAKFFMHKRKRITEEEEQTFFYTLDKICIISDILNGKADKYWLEVEYPDGWKVDNAELALEQRQKSQPSTPNPIVDAIREQTEAMKKTAEAIQDVAGAIRENPPVNANHYYAPGSTHDDKGKYLQIGTDDKEKLGLIEL